MIGHEVCLLLRAFVVDVAAECVSRGCYIICVIYRFCKVDSRLAKRRENSITNADRWYTGGCWRMACMAPARRALSVEWRTVPESQSMLKRHR